MELGDARCSRTTKLSHCRPTATVAGTENMSESTTQQIGDAGRQLCSSALLADALRNVLKLIDDQILVRNTDRDHDMRAFLQQAGQITRVLKTAQDALKSANEKLTDGSANNQ